MEHLVIVSRDRPELYGELERRFAGNTLVGVIFDRRVGERRARSKVRIAERRSNERRQADEDVQAEFWVAGYLIVRAR
jgi:hypothetical protein